MKVTNWQRNKGPQPGEDGFRQRALQAKVAAQQEGEDQGDDDEAGGAEDWDLA